MQLITLRLYRKNLDNINRLKLQDSNAEDSQVDEFLNKYFLYMVFYRFQKSQTFVVSVLIKPEYHNKLLWNYTLISTVEQWVFTTCENINQGLRFQIQGYL